MPSAAEELRQLHLLLQDLHQQKSELESGPRRIKAREQAVVKTEGEIATLKDAQTQLQKAADQKNLAFKSLQQKLGELEVKLNQAASNREFEILKTQIATEKSSGGKIEEEYLEVLEQIDVGKRRMQQLQAQLETAKAAVTSTKAEVAAAEAGLRERINALTAQVRSSEGCIPSSLSDNYRRRVAMGGPDALAAVDEDACSECSVELSPQHRVEVRMGNPVQCRECGRVLYSTRSRE